MVRSSKFSAKILIAICAWQIVALSGVDAQSSKPIPRGASIFVDEMENDLDGFIRAAIVDKKLPLTVVLRREEAHLVIAGQSSATQKAAWHEGWLTANRDRTEGNMMVFDRATKSLLLAAEAGDRSLFFGQFKKGGQRKVADRLVDKIKDNITRDSPRLPAPPSLAPEEMPSASSSSGIAGSSQRMTNQDVINLVTAGLSDELVIAKIHSSAKAFDISTDALVALKKAKVTDAVIAAMMK